MPALLVLALTFAPAEPIVLTAPDPIAGRVVDETGRPIWGVDVMLVGFTAGGKLGPHWRGRTDFAGRFQADQTGWFAAGLLPERGHPFLMAYRPGSRIAWNRSTALTPPTRAQPAVLVLRRPSGAMVRVVDPNGKPVPGALVRVTGRVTLPIPRELGIPDATTDADGNARFADLSRDDAVSFEITAAGFGVQEQGDVLSAARRTITLRPVGHLSGRVVADDPARARGVEVWGSAALPARFAEPSKSSGQFRTTTDAKGRFDVPTLAEGGVFFGAVHPARDLILTPPRDATLKAGGHADVELRLRRGIPVRGTVRERGTGRPIAGALFNVSSGTFGAGTSTSERGRTDASGRFEVYLLPGPIRFGLDYGGGYVFPADGPPTRFGARQLGTLPGGSDGIDLPPVELVRGVDVRGVVVDDAGKPAARARVHGSEPGGRSVVGGSIFNIPLLADSRGEFVVKALTPGVAVVWSAILDERISDAAEPIVPDAATPVRLVVRAGRTTSLRGRIVDEKGQPLADVPVNVRSMHKLADGKEITHSPSSDGDWTLRTDADGRFQTPRQLRVDEKHAVYAFVLGRSIGQTDWVDASAGSFPDLVLKPRDATPSRPNP